ncbi:methyltransferase domain-containing protein [Mariniflexile sp.]|uniref:methyltransferase domain-containing protein n=1 Tax=Mariniflexile sp. TaxID=1979402 RepID=UPI00356B075A
MDLSRNYWEDKYKTNDIGWDIGHIATPLKFYFDQLTNKNLKILIPGGGNSYEAEYLYNNGFKNVYVVDVSKTALNNLKQRVNSFPENQLICEDFFKLDMGFDIIIEQTFFCAIHPEHRPKYAKKTSQLLNEGGKLVGLLFNIPLNDSHPPFGGNKSEYFQYFNPYFSLEIFETCYNSIEKRNENELFIKFVKL